MLLSLFPSRRRNDSTETIGPNVFFLGFFPFEACLSRIFRTALMGRIKCASFHSDQWLPSYESRKHHSTRYSFLYLCLLFFFAFVSFSFFMCFVFQDPTIRSDNNDANKQKQTNGRVVIDKHRELIGLEQFNSVCLLILQKRSGPHSVSDE